MKVTAFLCEDCEAVFKESEAVGLIVKPPTLLETSTTYDITNNCDKCDYHFCLSCHRKRVTDLLKAIDRTKNEADYTFHYNLYSQKFYAAIHNKALLRSNAKNRKHKTLLQSLGTPTGK